MYTIFIAALFIREKLWEQHKCLLLNKKNVVYTYNRLLVNL